MTIWVAAPSAVPSQVCIIWNMANPSRSAAGNSPIGTPRRSCSRSRRAWGRQVRCEWYTRRYCGCRKIASANNRPISCAQLVAQAEPAMPQPSPKMNSWFSSALASVVTRVIHSVRRGRPMPLKNPSVAHTAAPTNAPPTRGSQKAAASCSICGVKAEGREDQVARGPDQHEDAAPHTPCPTSRSTPPAPHGCSGARRSSARRASAPRCRRRRAPARPP